jgi:hypothetical protein
VATNTAIPSLNGNCGSMGIRSRTVTAVLAISPARRHGPAPQRPPLCVEPHHADAGLPGRRCGVAHGRFWPV